MLRARAARRSPQAFAHRFRWLLQSQTPAVDRPPGDAPATPRSLDSRQAGGRWEPGKRSRHCARSARASVQPPGRGRGPRPAARVRLRPRRHESSSSARRGARIRCPLGHVAGAGAQHTPVAPQAIVGPGSLRPPRPLLCAGDRHKMILTTARAASTDAYRAGVPNSQSGAREATDVRGRAPE
jgi:hypothetical protein